MTEPGAYNADCMEAMKLFPDKFFDLAIVDPPYGININMNMGRRAGRRKVHDEKVWDTSIPDDAILSDFLTP